ncbi:MAG TPA: nuclear transport factor 2 family protein, partial [Flavobacterium sp.]|nr:nuclear transport factor 2 family protein [Flavobacterium sp.]
VWTPYEFYVNEKLSHSGVNAFTLFKENEKWKIIHLIDTRRK